ncbi:MAG: hypothetical protein J0L81_04530 [Caulobacterales bacterium]|jgi:hypothetical protein|nr:hypothetical protein [Caulobacterales bacterium]
MRRFAAGVLAVLMAACASGPPPGPPFVDLSEVSIDQLLGRSQGDVRSLLGAAAAEESLLFDAAELVDGVQVVSIGADRIFATADPCPEHYDLNHVSARVEDLPQRIDAFVFRDQRFEHLVGGRAGEAAPLPANTLLQIQCRREYHSTTGTGAGDVMTGVGALVFFAPVIGAALVGGAIGSTMDESDERAHALAALRLGAPIPGGVEAYASAHPHAVAIVDRQGERVALSVALDEDDDREDGEQLSVVVQEGAVQEVRAPVNWTCRLAANGAIQCER